MPVRLGDPLVLGGDGGELRLVLRTLPRHRRRLGVPAHRGVLVPSRDGRVQLFVFGPVQIGNTVLLSGCLMISKSGTLSPTASLAKSLVLGGYWVA